MICKSNCEASCKTVTWKHRQREIVLNVSFVGVGGWGVLSAMYRHVAWISFVAGHLQRRSLTWKYAIKVNTISRLNPRSFRQQRRRISNGKEEQAYGAIRRDFSCALVGVASLVRLLVAPRRALHAQFPRAACTDSISGPLSSEFIPNNKSS